MISPPDHPFGLPADPETIFVLIIIFGHPGGVGGSQSPGSQDGNLFVFGKQVHGRQGALGPDRSADDEVGLLFQDQFFNCQQGVADRHPRFQVAGIHHLDGERPLDIAHFHSALGIDFLHGQPAARSAVQP